MSIIEIAFIGGIVVLQLLVFRNVWKRINMYRNFFPSSFQSISIRPYSLSKETLKDPVRFNAFIDNLDGAEYISENDEDVEQIDLLLVAQEVKDGNPEFNEVIRSTNSYLCKNKGASADFNILQDICDRHIQKIDNEIGNLINVPLYIGLAGTFLGVIFGLSGIDFKSTAETTSSTISPTSIDLLIKGVIAAMVASLVGLGLTVWNTALRYKPAAYKNDTDKSNYYDFIQRELLPVLNTGMAGSLTTFKSVLNHFIEKFGENMDDYRDSGMLLNENLQKQQFVLAEINKLSLTQTSVKIIEVFSKLKESSEHLDSFRHFQKGLNESIEKTNRVLLDMNATIEHFKDFNANLKAIGTHTLSTLELQRDFKNSLEKHFPTIADHREVWRKQVDELNNDIKDVYKQLNEYFKNSTEHIQHFVTDNQSFFSGISHIQASLKVFVDNSVLQKQAFDIIRDEITGMRNDFKESQKESINTNKSLVEALKDLKFTLHRIEIPDSK